MVLSMLWIALIAQSFGYKGVIAGLALLASFTVYMCAEREEEDRKLVQDVLDVILAAGDDEEDEE